MKFVAKGMIRIMTNGRLGITIQILLIIYLLSNQLLSW